MDQTFAQTSHLNHGKELVGIFPSTIPTFVPHRGHGIGTDERGIASMAQVPSRTGANRRPERALSSPAI